MTDPSTDILLHGVAILEEAELWDWKPAQPIIMASGEFGGTVAARLLSGFLQESYAMSGSLADKFWCELEQCHVRFQRNVRLIKRSAFVSRERTTAILLSGVELGSVNFTPVLNMARELFTDLSLAFMNHSRLASGGGSESSVTDIVGMRVEEQMEEAKAEGFGTRKQLVLKGLGFKRDGFICVMTGDLFDEKTSPSSSDPIVTHIIPNSIHKKLDTLKQISMLASQETVELIMKHLNSIGNIVLLEERAHTHFDRFPWGIKAVEDGAGQTRYYHQRIYNDDGKAGPGRITLKHGDEIMFGQGKNGDILDGGPLAALCNLSLAVAKITRMSGAADIISQWKEDADDTDFPCVYLASSHFHDILLAKLALTGRVAVIK